MRRLLLTHDRLGGRARAGARARLGNGLRRTSCARPRTRARPGARRCRPRAASCRWQIEDGASMLVARAHPQAPTEEGWRGRVRAVAERGARAVASRSIAALSEREGVAGAEVLVLVPGGDEARRRAAGGRRAARARSQAPRLHLRARPQPRHRGPGELSRAASEALLAANVAQGSSEGDALAFEQTGAYRLLLLAMSENPPSCSASTRRRSSRSSPTTSSTRPIWCARWRRSSRPTATSPAPPSACSPTATRSTTASSGSASCRAGRQLQRRPREAQPRPQGDARARHRLLRRARLRGRR